MIRFRDIVYIIILSLIFSGIFFVIDYFFIPSSSDQEELYIEPTLPDDFAHFYNHHDDFHTHTHQEDMKKNSLTSATETWETWENTSSVSTKKIQLIKEAILQKKQEEAVHFVYVPSEFLDDAVSYETLSRDFLEPTTIQRKTKNLTVELYETLIDVRGKMKGGVVKMFGVLDMPESEYMSVFVHELSHYIDIHHFTRNAGVDTSNIFYDISWDSTTIIKAGKTQSDFVSWYAMTNKYEDFAETFTYYVFHNKDFFQKTHNSSTLKAKYDFFEKYVFLSGQFLDTDFSPDNKVKAYYWDITKIPINMKIFLQYMKNII